MKSKLKIAFICTYSLAAGVGVMVALCFIFPTEAHALAGVIGGGVTIILGIYKILG